MRTAGLLLLILGVVVATVAAMMDTTVTTTVPSSLGLGITDTQTIHNIGKQQTQLLTFASSAVAFLAGIVLVGLGEIQATMIESRVGIARLLKRGLVEADDEIPAEPAPVMVSNHQADVDPAVEAARAEEAARMAEQSDRWVKGMFVGVALLALAIAALVMFGPSSDRRPMATEANASALADNLEMQADNLEAEADALLANAR